MKAAVKIILGIVFVFCSLATATAGTNSYSLEVGESPTNNPLKGFMPYQGAYTTFPHSMEWNYLPLRSLMSGPTNFNWASLDALLNNVASRGHQTVFRIYLDYPRLPTGIPQYLLDAGLATHSYTDHGNNGISASPDYENPLLRQALTTFIAALGARYDGDSRIGFITLGLLGFWGEWHTYPHESWFASTAVQDEVMSAFEAAFTKTKLLVRYPSGTNPATRRLGYHDDSFAYQTIAPPAWMFLGLLKAAGDTNKWRTQPIGGEVRPEVQRCMWDASPTNCVPAGQEFARCVDLTHASWMLDHGVFSPGLTGAAKDLAVVGARKLGYTLVVSNALLVDASVSGPLHVSVGLGNTGVAPFYYDWPVQLGALSSSNTLTKSWVTTWKLSSLLPTSTNNVWSFSQTNHGLGVGSYKILLRVQNPLSNGVPFRFANPAQDADHPGWLTLGQMTITSAVVRPGLSGDLLLSGFTLHVNNAAPGAWTVQHSSDFASWTPLFFTNTSTWAWSITDAISSLRRFYRVAGSP
jgi:hypothetical protein